MSKKGYRPRTFKMAVLNFRQRFVRRRWDQQRAERGYRDVDVREMRTWLEWILPEMLEEHIAYQETVAIPDIPLSVMVGCYRSRQEQDGLSLKEYLAAGREGDRPEWREAWIGTLTEMRRLFLEAGERTCSKDLSEEQTRGMGEEELIAALMERDRYKDECRKKAYAMLGEYADYLSIGPP